MPDQKSIPVNLQQVTTDGKGNIVISDPKVIAALKNEGSIKQDGTIDQSKGGWNIIWVG